MSSNKTWIKIDENEGEQNSNSLSDPVSFAALDKHIVKKVNDSFRDLNMVMNKVISQGVIIPVLRKYDSIPKFNRIEDISKIEELGDKNSIAEEFKPLPNIENRETILDTHYEFPSLIIGTTGVGQIKGHKHNISTEMDKIASSIHGHCIVGGKELRSDGDRNIVNINMINYNGDSEVNTMDGIGTRHPFLAYTYGHSHRFDREILFTNLYKLEKKDLDRFKEYVKSEKDINLNKGKGTEWEKYFIKNTSDSKNEVAGYNVRFYRRGVK